jgi:hypothetical protein
MHQKQEKRKKKIMMNPVAWLKIQAEAVKHGIKKGQELLLINPLMTAKERNLRIMVSWCDHLEETKRGHLIYDKPLVNKMRETVARLDALYVSHSEAIPVNLNSKLN